MSAMGDRVPERELEEPYDRHSPERNFHEWGARVTAAMKKVKKDAFSFCLTSSKKVVT